MPKSVTISIVKVEDEQHPNTTKNSRAEFRSLEGHLRAQATLNDIHRVIMKSDAFIQLVDEGISDDGPGTDNTHKFTLYITQAE